VYDKLLKPLQSFLIILYFIPEQNQYNGSHTRDSDVDGTVWNIGTSSAASDLSDEVRFETLKSQNDEHATDTNYNTLLDHI
jgi:hypothetical protein